jgi:hypothetical protein
VRSLRSRTIVHDGTLPPRLAHNHLNFSLWTVHDGGNGKSGALGRLHCPGHVLLPERGRSAAPATGNGTLQISLLI